MNMHDHFAPSGWGANYCDESVCLSVCLSIYSHNSKTARPKFTKLLCVLPCGRESVFLCNTVCSLGMWMTSRRHIMALWRVMRISKQRYNTTSITGKIPTKCCSTTKTGSIDRELRTRGEICSLRLRGC